MICKQGRVHILDHIKGVGGMYLMLYLDSVEPDEDTEHADLTPASFPGYSDSSVTWDTPALNGDDDAEMNFAAPITFTHAGGGSLQAVYGAALYGTYGGGNKLYGWKHFPAPIIMDTAGQTITIETFRFRQGAMA